MSVAAPRLLDYLQHILQAIERIQRYWATVQGDLPTLQGQVQKLLDAYTRSAT